jgi:formylglycine-generating enzyme
MKSEKNFILFMLLGTLLILAASCQSQGSGLNVKSRNVRVDITPTVTPPAVAEYIFPERADPMLSGPLPSDSGELIYVPAGDFVMGSPLMSPNAEKDEYPGHTVYLDGFWIHKNEVSNEMYSKCVLEGPCAAPDIDNEQFGHPYNDIWMTDHPVTDVNWIQATTYCEWINGRLPTEAEWEKTARGTQPLLYPWGGFEPNCGFADLDGCEEGTSEIGTRLHGQSPFEALDMAGNVREWVYDLYSPDYYSISSYHNPPGPREGENRVARGGGWQDLPADVRTANRFELHHNTTEADLGFRCVVLNESAPMCQLSYQPLCAPGTPGSPGFQPGRPGKNCVPGGGLDPDQIAVQFGCVGPSVQQMNINLRSELTGTEEIRLNGLDYDCETNDEYPDRLFCKGPSAVQGQANDVTVCRGGCTPNPCPANYTFDAQQETCLPPAGGNGIDCVAGSFYNTGTKTCQSLDPNGGDRGYGNCAPGFSNKSDTEPCYPDPENGNNNGCPEGTFFDTSSERCVSDGNNCSSGFYFDPYTEQCQPTTFSNLSCPAGSYFNPVVNCCVPYGSEMSCAEGFTFDTRVMYCIPEHKDGQCPKGYAYDALDETCRSTGEGNTQCPPNYFYDKGLESCQPMISEYSDPGRDCPEGSFVDQYTGSCTPVHTNAGQDDCADSYYLDKNNERCISTRNGCPIGTYFEPSSERCVPTTGLTSGCPSGTYFSDWFACCAPSNDFGRQGCPQGFFFDTGLGYCTRSPDKHGYCGEDFHLDTFSKRCITNRVHDDATPCPGGLVFDIDLGYCSPTPDENSECSEGFFYDSETERCVIHEESNLGCPSGYSFDTELQQCFPGTLGLDSSLSCVTVIAQAPKCSSSTP